VIHNPIAGARRRRRFAATLEALAAWRCTVVVRETTRRGDAEEFAREGVGDFDAIVAAGGDGTINEVVNGMGASSTPLGIIPLGTANVLAAEIGLPLTASAVATVLASALPRAIFPGVVNGRRFLMMAGIGIDARVVEQVQPALKRALGKGAYVLCAAAALRTPLPEYAIEIDGVRTRAASIVVAKGRSYGGAFVLAPQADLGAPSFQACLLASGNPATLLSAAGALATARTGRSAAFRMLIASQVFVGGPSGEPVQADGDIVARLPAVIQPAATPLLLLAP